MGGPQHGAPAGDGPIQSETGGVKPMSIQGRFHSDRERLSGMNEAERAWRKQWLKDQVLSPHEPVYVARDSKELLNPIRRFYRWPLDQIFYKYLQPVIGPTAAKVGRFYVGRGLMGVYMVYMTLYYFKYNQNDWTSNVGWRVIKSRTAQYPGDPGYPGGYAKDSPRDYNDRGFKDSVYGNKYDNNRKLDDEAIITPEQWK